MATCKDCFHYDICKKYEQDIQVNFYEQEFDEQEFIDDGICSLFKDKADYVPAVRCKDCKYLMFSDFYGECYKGYMGIVSPDNYCSYGERKEE